MNGLLSSAHAKISVLTSSGRDEVGFRVGDLANWSVDRPGVVGGPPFDHREIDLPDGPFLEADRETAMREMVLGGDHDAGGVTIQAMDDAGTQQSRGGGRLVEVPLQGIDERVGPIDRGRVDDHPGRLVDRHQPPVLVDHLERRGRGPEQLVGRFEQADADLLTRIDTLPDIGHLAVDEDGSGPHQAVNAEPGVVAEFSADDRIDSSAAEILGDREANFRRRGRYERVFVRHRELQRAQ